jgi:glycosyltransferase involved in cell wall biosynthesis
MSEHLDSLLESILTSGVSEETLEVIVVNDGSTDSTESLLQQKLTEPFWSKHLKVLNHFPARGRYESRLLGAKAAQGTLLFFLDSRVELLPEQGHHLRELLGQHSHLMGMPEIDETQSLFNLYWKRSHQFIFRKHFSDVKNGFYLNSENYEQYAKGTGMLIVPKADFLQACEKLGPTAIQADDTLLLQQIVERTPLFVCEKLSFAWEPRQTWVEFLKRLMDRGPGFVQYHFGLRTFFFYVFVACLLGTVCLLGFSWIYFSSLLPGLLLLFILAVSTVLMMTRNLWEIIRLAPLHILVLVSFSLGIVYGIYFQSLQYLSKPRRS